MLWDPARHETLRGDPWDEALARQEILRIATDAERHWSPQAWWPAHPQDFDPGEDPQAPNPSLYFGACGVMWALDRLQHLGLAPLPLVENWRDHVPALLHATEAWHGKDADLSRAAWLMGATPIRLFALGDPDLRDVAEHEQALQALIRGNMDHPARELMWGAPGTLLAALHLHRRSGQALWAELFRETAARLWSQLEWSAEFGCHHWTQDLYGRRSTYVDAVHGFVATASPLIGGRALLDAADWSRWQAVIAQTVRNTATWDGARANWWPAMRAIPGRAMLMQYCHGAPGFVICLGGFPGHELDDLLRAAGEATWAAGPLTKGSNLCHGTGGNGYAFLKLWQRTGEPVWLERARAFAMHGIVQTREAFGHHGRGRYSLWTGDVGFALYLRDCIAGEADFPTLDVF